MSNFKKTTLKIGAYVILVLGLLFFLSTLLLGVFLLVSYPEAMLSKKAIIAAGILGISAIILLVTISFFESILELIKLDTEVSEIVNHGKDSNYFMRQDG